MPDADRYLRIASRTVAENCTLAEALRAVIDSPPQATDVDE
jgi:histidinol-phosphate/aromatic aminotransferase/cobyric acid decarboxylase-like protein